MNSTTFIEHKKLLVDLPIDNDQLEYWGPFGSDFSNSFLTMSDVFLKQFFKNELNLFFKSVFSSFVELVQNVAEYNEEEFSEDLPNSYLRLRIEKDFILMQTANIIKDKDVNGMEDRLITLFSYTDDELITAHNKALLSGGSLGLLMIKKAKCSTFDYLIERKKETNWLSLEFKIKYGSNHN